MQFSEFLGVLRSGWRVIVACVVLAVLAAAVMTWMSTPVYTAQARIYLSAEPKEGERVVPYELTGDDLETFMMIASSPEVLDPLREELGMDEGHPIDVRATQQGATAIVNVTAESSDPQEAADVANALGPQLSRIAGEYSGPMTAAGRRAVSKPIQPASVPSSPSSPNIPANLMLALLAGLAVGVGLALLRHALDSKVHTEADIANQSQSPVLADLPLERKSSGESLVSVDSHPHGSHAEAMRRLRTNLLFVDVTTGKHSFVISSAMPGEGKTTTAVNLALAMADAGTRTLLVDGDLRRPSVASMLGLESSVGLTTVLLGMAQPNEVIQSWGAAGLHVLPAGATPPNPSELLGSGPMEDLFRQLQQDYDFILIDSPPVVPVIDAVILERLTGGLLMVVAADRTKKRNLASALKQLTTVGAHVSGFALNFVSGRDGTTYRYGYGSAPDGAAADQTSLAPPVPKRAGTDARHGDKSEDAQV